MPTTIPSGEEIEAIIFGLHSGKILGSDGMSVLSIRLTGILLKSW